MGRFDIGPHARTENLLSRGISSPYTGEANSLHVGTAVAQWLRSCATNQ